MEEIDERMVLDEKNLDDNSNVESAGKGRVLYCRKCEGHGQQVILKGHAPLCPHILCQCLSCEKLMNKRLKSFSKRNREKIQLATRKASQGNRRVEVFDGEDSRRGSPALTPSSGTCTPDTVMSVCSSQQPSSSKSSSAGLEGRSMSMGTMTVMSYDIWKAKCAAEKKKREEKEKEEKERKASLPARPVTPEVIPRKRAHTFVSMKDAQLPRIRLNGQKDEKKGRYITLPTIPPLSVLIPDDDVQENEIQPKKSKEESMIKEESPLPKVLPAPVARKIGANLTPPTFYLNPSVTSVTTTPISTPAQSRSFPQVPFSMPQISQPSPLPTSNLSNDHLLTSSMLAQTCLPSPFFLQNSFLNAIPQQPQPNIFSLLGGDLTTLLASLSQFPTTVPQPNLFEVLQRTVQLQQLTTSLSALSPPGGSPPIDTTSLNQLINRQPLFSSTI